MVDHSQSQVTRGEGHILVRHRVNNNNKQCANMGKDLVDLSFFRESAEEPWGFRLAGGKDYGQPLSISQVGLIGTYLCNIGYYGSYHHE